MSKELDTYFYESECIEDCSDNSLILRGEPRTCQIIDRNIQKSFDPTSLPFYCKNNKKYFLQAQL